MTTKAKFTHRRAAKNLLRVISEGRLIRGSWHKEAADGRQLACMLYAMGNGLVIDSPEKCPSAVMPRWLAEMVPPMFDGQTDVEAFAWAARFAKQMDRPKWARLDWEKVRKTFLIGVVEQALDAARPSCGKETYWAAVESSARQVQDALRGKGTLDAAWAAARAAAWDAAGAAAEAAARAAAWAAAGAAAGAAAEAAAWAAAEAAARAAQAKLLGDIIDGELAR